MKKNKGKNRKTYKNVEKRKEMIRIDEYIERIADKK